MGSLFKKSYSSTAVIAADQKTVWNTLTALANYHLWNPFTPIITTSWIIGSKVELTVQMKADKAPIQQTEYLSRLEPASCLAWGIHWGPFLKAERIQKVTPQDDGTTLYFTEDVIEGPLCPLVHAMYGKDIQAGFDGVAQGLKAYLEKKE